MGTRVGGIIQFKVNGQQLNAKGQFTYGYGKEERKAIEGSDRIHGFTSKIQTPYIEGEITDTGDLSIETIAAFVDETITLELANGKIFALYGAWSTNKDGISGQTDESNIAVRFEGLRAKEVRA